MNIAICDDDRYYTDTVVRYLDAENTSRLDYEVFHSGEELLRAYGKKTRRPDAVFLDMEMGGANGMETADAIKKADEHAIIVFVSSHSNYMQESFKCQPFRFLVKPVKKSDLDKVIEEIEIKLKDRAESIIFSESRTRVRLYCEDIILFESSGHFVIIHTKNGAYKVRKSLNELTEEVDSLRFCRVHRAFFVNLGYIKKIGESELMLYGFDRSVPVSRRYKKDLTDAFFDYSERKYIV